MNSKSSCSLLFAVLAASGCATFEPVPKDYIGPTATLRDTGFSESAGKAQLFAAVAIDGNRITNAFGASAAASQGRGNMLSTVFPERKVKVMSMKVALNCSHATGAPIAAIASQIAGTFFSVDGEVDFAPVQGGTYLVNGDLKKEKSSCWIEDQSTGKPVTSVISK